MTFEEIHKLLQAKITPKRFRHIEGVVEAAEKLATIYGENVQKAKLAALLHDCCKEYPVLTLRNYIEQENSVYNNQQFLEFVPLLHGPAGAIVAKNEYGVDDETILEAIRVHTVGKSNMSLMDKIIFVADYIEKNRDFPGVNKMRVMALKDLDRAVLMGYDSTISFIIKQQKPLYEGTIIGRNHILKVINNRG